MRGARQRGRLQGGGERPHLAAEEHQITGRRRGLAGSSLFIDPFIYSVCVPQCCLPTFDLWPEDRRTSQVLMVHGEILCLQRYGKILRTSNIISIIYNGYSFDTEILILFKCSLILFSVKICNILSYFLS